MVEICRWPKASFSVSSIICAVMPSRPALPRSMSTKARRPPSCTSSATWAKSGSRFMRRTSLFAQLVTWSASVPVSVYWYCERLAVVAIWMSCTGLTKAVAPGIAPSSPRTRSAIARASSRRSSDGLSVSCRWATLEVGFSVPTPMTATTPVTAGSVLTARSASACSRPISAKEAEGAPSSTTSISPVSCTGRKPFGTTT